MKELIENLFPMNACLMGEGYDNRLEYLKHLLDLEVIEIPSGTKLGTWTVPDEWIVRDAWVKFKGEKIIDYKKDPLSLVIGSTPQHGTVDLKELKAHLHYSEDRPDATPFIFRYYDKDWGFCLPKTQLKEKVLYDEEGKMICEDGVCYPDLKEFGAGKVQIEGQDYKPKFRDKFEEGDYEVFIDTEYVPGVMKIGVHTIKGTSDREVLLFAHLDHPYQANDNLSAVACLVDLAGKIKCEHTVKIIFCPETIGSIGYALTQDISKVDFVVAVDICGNNNNLMLQKSLDAEKRINRVAHLAIQGLGEMFRKSGFRHNLGSDEYVFNDPAIGIPGLMLTREPYVEYHTSEDTPDKINYENIEKTGQAILKIIEIYEKDYIPKREYIGPLMRSKYGIESPTKQTGLLYDYFFYSIDGKRSLVELCSDFDLNFELTYDILQSMQAKGDIGRIDIGQVGEQKTAGKKRTRLPRTTNVSGKRKKVPEDIR